MIFLSVAYKTRPDQSHWAGTTLRFEIFALRILNQSICLAMSAYDTKSTDTSYKKIKIHIFFLLSYRLDSVHI